MFLLTGGGSSALASAQDSDDTVEDLADGEDDTEATVESDEPTVEGTGDESTVAETDTEKVCTSNVSGFVN